MQKYRLVKQTQWRELKGVAMRLNAVDHLEDVDRRTLGNQMDAALSLVSEGFKPSLNVILTDMLGEPEYVDSNTQFTLSPHCTNDTKGSYCWKIQTWETDQNGNLFGLYTRVL